MSDARAPDATVLITTKNRVDDLCRAIESALAQSANLEVLVIDDGSTDGTSEIVAARYPEVRIKHNSSSQGYITGRNEGAELAEGDFIFSIDDDAIFSSPQVVEDTLVDFNADPRVGAVAIACIDVNKSPKLRQPLPEREDVYVTSEYIGTAHAVRRAVFLEMEGYREPLVHQGEERDFCLRLLDAGYFVRLGTSDPIHHFESPKRDLRRQDFYGRRNDVLFAWQNVPGMTMPVHLMGTTFNGVKFSLKVRRPFRMAWGLTKGYVDIVRGAAPRSPVKPRTYSLFRELRRRGAMPIDEALRYLKDDDQPVHANATQ